MTSLQGLLPHPGSSNWRKSRSLTTDSDEDCIVVRHVVIREVWLEKRPWPHAVYKIDVMSQTSHWFVFKRYKEFYQLHQKIVKLYGVPRDLLPPRKLANNMAKENLESRRESLEHYLQKLLNSCNGAVRRSDELADFLDVKSHDVPHVTYDLARYLQKNGQNILMSKEIFHLSPSQLYCITKQLQLPHPSGKMSVDLGNLYEFVAELKKLSIIDFISQLSNGEQHEISFTFDLSMFTSLKELQLDACDIESVRGIPNMQLKLNKLTARYCLTSMKSLLIDAAIEKTAPQVSLSAESWRVQAAYRLAETQIILQPWHALAYINFSHNNISTFDSSMSLLPALKQLDLSHNKIHHLDLQLVTSSSLNTLSLANNVLYLISGTTKTIDNLKNLNLSHNKIQSMEGLLCCQGLEDLNLAYNSIALIAEVKKLASLPNLGNLSVAGNHFTKRKRHRIILFAYFRERELILDKRPIILKEQAKLDAKFAALERFEDMDDSLSSISTVSDDSDLDSGIDPWISKLSSLSEVEENDYEVIPKITWDELDNIDNEIDSTYTSQTEDIESSNGDIVSNTGDNISNNGGNRRPIEDNNFKAINRNHERLSRDDWDRILKTTSSPVLCGTRPRNMSSFSGNALCENTDRCSTICDDNPDDISTWVNTGAIPKRLDRTQSNQEHKRTGEDLNVVRSISVENKSNTSKERTGSWVTNLFKRTSSNQNEAENKTMIPHKFLEEVKEGNLVLIPEVEEVKVQEEDVSKSFDDNCEFERAEECDEDDELD